MEETAKKSGNSCCECGLSICSSCVCICLCFMYCCLFVITVEFVQNVLCTLGTENWSSVPLVFITQGLSCIQPDAILDSSTLASVRSVRCLIDTNYSNANIEMYNLTCRLAVRKLQISV